MQLYVNKYLFKCLLIYAFYACQFVFVTFRFLFIRFKLPFMGITESHSMCMGTPPLNSPLIHLSFSILQLSKRHFWANKPSKSQLTNRNIHRKNKRFFY